MINRPQLEFELIPNAIYRNGNFIWERVTSGLWNYCKLMMFYALTCCVRIRGIKGWVELGWNCIRDCSVVLFPTAIISFRYQDEINIYKATAMKLTGWEHISFLTISNYYSNVIISPSSIIRQNIKNRVTRNLCLKTAYTPPLICVLLIKMIWN